MEDSAFLFPAGQVRPRIDWLNILIDKYSIKAKYKIAKGLREQLKLLTPTGKMIEENNHIPVELCKYSDKNLYIEFYGLCAFVGFLSDLEIFNDFEVQVAKEIIDKLMKQYRSSDNRYMFAPGDIDSRVKALHRLVLEYENNLERLDLKIKYLSNDSQKA